MLAPIPDRFISLILWTQFIRIRRARQSCNRIVSFDVHICALPCNGIHVILQRFFVSFCSICRRCIVSYWCIVFISWIMWKVFVRLRGLIARLVALLSECHSCICIFAANSKQPKQPSAFCYLCVEERETEKKEIIYGKMHK